MTFDAFLESGWNDHADRAQEVADRIAASFDVVELPEHVPPFVRLLVHVYGEHLGTWQRGVNLLESLRKSPACDGSPSAGGSIARGIAALRYAGGTLDDSSALSVEDRVCALATASSALAARQDLPRAIATFEQAAHAAQAGLPAGSPANRALAVAGNNLAATLEERADRDALQTTAMVAAAEAGLKFWKLAGTWLEEERAEYRLARSLLHAGQALAAMRPAKRCLDVCEQNDAPPFERFFAHAVVASAHRAAGDAASFETHRHRAWSELESIPEDDRKWCAADLADLAR